MSGLNRVAGRLAAALADRIDERAVLEQTEVEVRPGRGAGRPDPADDLILIDAGPGADARGERRQVQIVGLDAAVVADAHLVAAGTGPAGRDDRAARDRDHRSAVRRRVVDAEVGAHGVVHRMQPAAREAAT